MAVTGSAGPNSSAAAADDLALDEGALQAVFPDAVDSDDNFDPSVVVYKLEQVHALPNDISDADLVDDFHDGTENAPAYSATVLEAAGLCELDTLGPVVRPIRAAPAATASVAA